MSSPRNQKLITSAALLAALGLVVLGTLQYTGRQRVTRQFQAELSARPPHPDTLRRLLDGGADPQAVGARHKNLLMAAAEANAPDLVTRALNLGLSPSSRDTAGLSALEYAVNAAQGRTEPTAVVQTLVDHGADLNGVTMAYGGPLFNAASYGEVEVVKILVTAGANADQQDHRGYTALFHAALAGKAETVAALLSLGADPFIRAKDGRTVAEETRSQCAQQLRATKADKAKLAETEATCRSVLHLLP